MYGRHKRSHIFNGTIQEVGQTAPHAVGGGYGVQYKLDKRLAPRNIPSTMNAIKGAHNILVMKGAGQSSQI